MRRTILAIAMAGFAAAPAFAMDDMSCADFTAMDAAGRAGDRDDGGGDDGLRRHDGRDRRAWLRPSG